MERTGRTAICGIGTAALLALLGACAAPGAAWEKPGAGDAETKSHARACQAFAAAEADRRYRHDYPERAGVAEGPGDAFAATMAGNEAVLFRNRVFEQCMQTHGYRKAGATAKP